MFGVVTDVNVARHLPGYVTVQARIPCAVHFFCRLGSARKRGAYRVQVIDGPRHVLGTAQKVFASEP